MIRDNFQYPVIYGAILRQPHTRSYGIGDFLNHWAIGAVEAIGSSHMGDRDSYPGDYFYRLVDNGIIDARQLDEAIKAWINVQIQGVNKETDFDTLEGIWHTWNEIYGYASKEVCAYAVTTFHEQWEFIELCVKGIHERPSERLVKRGCHIGLSQTVEREMKRALLSCVLSIPKERRSNLDEFLWGIFMEHWTEYGIGSRVFLEHFLSIDPKTGDRTWKPGTAEMIHQLGRLVRRTLRNSGNRGTWSPLWYQLKGLNYILKIFFVKYDPILRCPEEKQVSVFEEMRRKRINWLIAQGFSLWEKEIIQILDLH